MGLLDYFRRDNPQASLKRFEESLDSLERRVKAVEMEWELAYDKLHSMMGRIARRAEKLHNEAEDAGRLAPLSADETTVPGLPIAISHLSPRQRAIQSQILARRGQRVNGREVG
jgi:hypothetical protein